MKNVICPQALGRFHHWGLLLGNASQTVLADTVHPDLNIVDFPWKDAFKRRHIH